MPLWKWQEIQEMLPALNPAEWSARRRQPLVDEWVLYDNSGEEPVRLDEVQVMIKVEKKGQAPERDPDLVNSEAALRRAAQRAREQARRSVGYVVVYRKGKIVEDWLNKRVACV